MSHPTWPAGLVQFERSAWQGQPHDTRRRSQASAAPPRFRRGLSRAAKRQALSLIVGRADLATFWHFYDQDCAEGSLMFWMPDPITDGWPLLTGDRKKVLDHLGRPLLMAAKWLCQWGDETPAESIKADTDFRVSFSVWVMP